MRQLGTTDGMSPCGAARDYVKLWRPIIDRRLNEHVAGQGGPHGIFVEPLGYLLSAGGKRFRPILAIAACELVGGNPRDAVDVACAIECFHTSSLILDDLPCMDDAVHRRGVEALHRRYGVATAILVALAFFNLAHEILAAPAPGASPNAGPGHRFVAGAIGANGMIGGQWLDLQRDLQRAPPRGTGDFEAARLLKTSALIAAAAVAGAYAGGATPEQIACIERFGYSLGQTFQRADDRLDADEDASAQGAPVTPESLGGEIDDAVGDLQRCFPVQSPPRLVVEGLAQFVARRAMMPEVPPDGASPDPETG